MNAQKLDQPGLLDVSPVLEEGSSTPLSTSWIPLHELITHWTDIETMMLPAPVVPLLTAIGHALFALAREARAVRLYNLAWEKQQQQDVPDAVTRSRSQQVVGHLQERPITGVAPPLPSIPCCQLIWSRQRSPVPANSRASPAPSKNACGS